MVDFFCQTCPSGQTTIGVGDICRQGASPCPPGSYTASNGACLFCGVGARLNMQKNHCELCPANHASPGGLTTKCRRCRFGLDRFNRERCYCKPGSARNDNEKCRKYPRGSHTITRDTCRLCFAGSFAKGAGTASCTECPAGTVASETGAKEVHAMPRWADSKQPKTYVCVTAHELRAGVSKTNRVEPV